jgi:ABC-type lipoprotein release transport system permease subunit
VNIGCRRGGLLRAARQSGGQYDDHDPHRQRTSHEGFRHNRNVFHESHKRIVIAFGCAAALAAVSAAGDVRKPVATSDVLVSRQLLARAHLTIGDVVTVATDPAGTRAAQFRVAGVFEPTPDPMKFNVERLEARLHLDDLLTLTADPADPASNESVTSINVSLADPAGAAAFSRTLAARIPLVGVNPAVGAESATFTVIDRFHTAIAAVTVIGSTAFLLALMVIRAEERKETVGILRLIGISSKSIMAEVIVEGLLVAVGGAVVGVTIALLAQRAVNLIFQARYDTTLVFVRVTPSIALRSVAVAVPVGVIAGAVASWTLLRRGAAALVKR